MFLNCIHSCFTRRSTCYPKKHWNREVVNYKLFKRCVWKIYFDLRTKILMYLINLCIQKFVRQWEYSTQISDEIYSYDITRVMWKFKPNSKKSIDTGSQFPVNKFTNTYKGFIFRFFFIRLIMTTKMLYSTSIQP